MPRYNNVLKNKEIIEAGQETGSVSPLQQLGSVIGNSALLQINHVSLSEGILQCCPEADTLIADHGLVLERTEFYKSPMIYVQTQADSGIDGRHDHENNCIYFYRSMRVSEADSWLNGDGIIDMNSGQPWATNFEYSKLYMNGTHGKYPIMLEAYVPGFIRKAKALGISDGKPEGTGKAFGNVSWGTGYQSENAFGLPPDGDAAIDTEISRITAAPDSTLKPNAAAHAQSVRRKTQGAALTALPRQERQKLALGGIYKARIQSIRVVYLHRGRYNQELQK